MARFESRVGAFAGRQDLAVFTVNADREDARAFAREYLGEGEHTATGIDGSMDFDERLQMMLFYSNATAYSCPISISDDVRVDLDSARRDSRLAASAAVPLWAEDLGDVLSDQLEVDIELEHSLEKIPNAFMTLGELYLAVEACEKSKVVFLDRPISGTYSTLARDARLLLRRRESKLTKWKRESSVTLLDLFLAINLGPPTMHVSTRPRYLRMALIRELSKGPATVSELCTRLGVSQSDVDRARKRLMEAGKSYGGRVLEEGGPGALCLAEEARGFWERVVKLALDYSRDVFGNRKHPLALNSEEYLTILDVSTVCLVLLEYLQQLAHEKRILLIGIAKDTTATDISRAVMPFAAATGQVDLSAPQPKLKNDRAFLAILSAENPAIRTPWRTMGYDSCFSTIVSFGGKLVSARKAVSRERIFVRSYFQLRTLKSDQAVRSQVFLFDRPYESEDAGSDKKFKVVERDSESQISAYFEGRDGSRLSNLALFVLSLCDNPEVFEAFGHNQLLFLADKAVKAEVKMLRSSLRGVADLRVGGASTRSKIFGLVTTYREQRAEAEYARTRRAR
ncbi:MAG TPA: ArsR family transcriptional regulator [Nitrososphaerales archaeon]|nr:ArsR family transcriptional regulator [Nitrososphaerales archaeon]